MTNITENTNTAYLYIVVCGDFRCTCSAFQGTVVGDLDRVPYKVLVNDNDDYIVIMTRGKVIGICPITNEEVEPEDIPAPFVNGGLNKVIDEITR